MEVNNLIVFDGICNLCSRAVLFIIKRDRDSIFRFVSMQSNTGNELLKHYGMDPNNIKTILLIKNGKSYLKSNAALEIAKDLKGAWQLFRIFRFVPQFIRDWFYDIIAENRHHWFGKKTSCMVPPEHLRNKFLD